MSVLSCWRFLLLQVFISVPIFGRVTLFQHWNSDGVILLIAALLSLAFSFFGRFGLLWLSGGIGLFEVGNLFYFFYRIPEIVDRYNRQAGNGLVISVGQFAFWNNEHNWGAALIIGGTMLTLAVAINSGVYRRSMVISAKLGMFFVALVLVWNLLLYFFPYLRYWRALFER